MAPRLLATVALLASLMGAASLAQTRVTLEQALPVLRALGPAVPAPLRIESRGELEARWESWVEQHDRDVRARLSRGDEDSLVNFWMYGTTFTRQLPVVARGSALPEYELEEVAGRRLDDLLDRLAGPLDDERLEFARAVLIQRGVSLTTAAGRARARDLLTTARQRMKLEFERTERAQASVSARDAGARAGTSATVFRERGLSADTSVLADQGVHVALDAMARLRTLSPGSVRRVAIVGPGLDFTNKADGYDFYPQQSIQPFAVVDALRRTRLAAPDLQITTFDISARVNAHLRGAVERARSAGGYVVQLPLDASERWTDELIAYWQRWGSEIGREQPAIAPPSAVGKLRMRAVRISPDVVSSVRSTDLNIVVDRLHLPDGDRFDLIVATNVLLYYDVFEQALAAANVAAMLAPSGVFLTNTAVLPMPPLQASASYQRVRHTSQRHDDMYWYVRDK